MAAAGDAQLNQQTRSIVAELMLGSHNAHTIFQVTMSFPSSFLPSPPDPTSRQPFTNAAILHLNLLYYILAVLTILPHTFILKLVLLPIILWQTWKCAAGLDFSLGFANSLGLEVSAGLSHLNNLFVVQFYLSF